jgi:DNA-binding XRE family transcriptional regulator
MFLKGRCPMDIKEIFAQRIKELRKEHDYGVRQLAAMVGI